MTEAEIRRLDRLYDALADLQRRAAAISTELYGLRKS